MQCRAKIFESLKIFSCHLGLLVATLNGFLWLERMQQMARMTATMTRATAAGKTTYNQMLKSEHWGRPQT